MNQELWRQFKTPFVFLASSFVFPALSLPLTAALTKSQMALPTHCQPVDRGSSTPLFVDEHKLRRQTASQLRAASPSSGL